MRLRVTAARVPFGYQPVSRCRSPFAAAVLCALATVPLPGRAEAAPTLSPLSLPGGVVETPYAQAPAAVGGTGPVTFAVTAGATATTAVTLDFGTADTQKAVEIPLLSSLAVDRTQTVRLLLANPTGGAIVGPRSAATLALREALGFAITTTTLVAGAVGSPYACPISIGNGGVGPTFSWSLTAGALPVGLALVGQDRTALIVGTPLTVADAASLTIQAADDGQAGVTASATFSLTVNPAASTTPVVDDLSVLLSPGAVGQPYFAFVTATQGTPPYVWGVSGGSLPPGLVLDAFTGEVAGTPLTAGTTSFTVQVTDSAGKTATATAAITIADNPVGVATLGLPDGTLGAPYAQPVAATGGVGPTYTWSMIAGALPPGLGIAGTGPVLQVTGTPTVAGQFAFTLQASDDGQTGVAGAQGYAIGIAPPMGSPAITTSTLAGATEGMPFMQTLTVAGGTGPWSWSAMGALPAGVALDAATGALTTTAASVAGAYSLTVSVTDRNALRDRRTLLLAIAPPPAILTTSLPNAVQGNGYGTLLTAAGGTPPLEWGLVGGTLAGGQTTGGGLPAGVSLSTQGLLAGVPAMTGAFPLAVTLTDANGASATSPLSVRVLALASGPVVLTTAVPPGTVGSTYATQVIAAGGTLPYVAWSVSAGALPTGLSLDAISGMITGTPTAAAPASFAVSVTDSASMSATSGTLALDVIAPLAITTSSPLPVATVGQPYSVELTTSGGAAPLTFQLLGAPPPGLAFTATGLLAGIATTAGSYALAVTAIDSLGIRARKDLALTVAPGAIAIVSGDGQTGAVSVEFPEPVVIQVTDGAGSPVAGVPVTLTAPASDASATFTPASGTTGADGQLTVAAQANELPGAYSVAVSAYGLGTSFLLTNAVPANLVVQSGGGQSTDVGASFAAPVVVAVTDIGGAALANVAVTITPPTSGSSAAFTPTSLLTNAQGTASATATANAIAGGPYAVALRAGNATASLELTNRGPGEDDGAPSADGAPASPRGGGTGCGCAGGGSSVSLSLLLGLAALAWRRERGGRRRR